MSTHEVSADQGPWLAIGLGNPGSSYADDRHNIGHMVVDLLAERQQARFRANQRARADVVEGRVGGVPGVRCVLAKTRSYMNLSGGPVGSLLAYYQLDRGRLVVIHDELDIPFGTVRLKFGGGDNGHNGLRSIRRSLGSGDYFRLRVGVGRPDGRQEVTDFLLAPFSSAERKELPFVVDRAADALECLLVDGLERAQNHYHAS